MIAPGSASHSAWDGRIYFIEDGIRVRRIEGDGSLRTVAGPPPNAEGESAEGGFLLGNDFSQVGAIAATSKATCWSPTPAPTRFSRERFLRGAGDRRRRLLLPDLNTVGFSYDGNGNIEGATPPGKPAHVFTYTKRNQLATYVLPDAGSGIDVNGEDDERDRMLTYGAATYTWSEAGELQSKTEGGFTATYDYDVFGNLRKVELPNGIEIEYLTDGARRGDAAVDSW